MKRRSFVQSLMALPLALKSTQSNASPKKALDPNLFRQFIGCYCEEGRCSEVYYDSKTGYHETDKFMPSSDTIVGYRILNDNTNIVVYKLRSGKIKEFKIKYTITYGTEGGS